MVIANKKKLSYLRIIITSNVVWIILFGILALTPSDIFADDNTKIPVRITVGVTDLPPFSMKTTDGRWFGLGIELWELIAEDIGIKFEIREYERIKQITEAIQNKKIHLTPLMSITEFNETIMDLSHPYQRSGLAIAVPLQSRVLSWSQSVRRIASISSLELVVVLILISLIAGFVIWLLERNHNPEMFGDKLSRGIGHGIWWAMVTMTTVGYGDKAPKTIGGRLIAVLWMFFSIFLIASYTAVITSSLTLNELSGRVRGSEDLPNVSVGALSRSNTLEFLVAKGIPAIPYESIKDGLQAVVQSQIDAFVDDELQLKYIIKYDFPGRLHVLPETFAQYYVSMAIPPASQLREQINRTLAKIMDREAWTDVQARYIGKIY